MQDEKIVQPVAEPHVPAYLIVALENAKKALDEQQYEDAKSILDYVLAEVKSGDYEFIR